jgi:hypothetical protein
VIRIERLPGRILGLAQGVLRGFEMISKTGVILSGIPNTRSKINMNLAIWLPSLFVAGIVSMAGVYLFLIACEHI